MLNVIKEITNTFEKNNLNMKNQHTQKKQEHTHIKNLKDN